MCWPLYWILYMHYVFYSQDMSSRYKPLLCTFYQWGNWSLVKLNNLLKETCSAVSRRAENHLSSIVFSSFALYYQCLPTHVSKGCSNVQLDTQQVFSVDSVTFKGVDNWFLGEGERNLSFLHIKHIDIHIVHNQMYSTFVILKFWGAIIGTRRSKKGFLGNGGWMKKKKLEKHWFIVLKGHGCEWPHTPHTTLKKKL